VGNVEEVASLRLGLFGPEPQFSGDDSGQELNQLEFARGAVEGPASKAFNLRQQGAQTRPELIAGRYRLEVFSIHPSHLHSWFAIPGGSPVHYLP
jgi:hypothetical protein